MFENNALILYFPTRFKFTPKRKQKKFHQHSQLYGRSIFQTNSLKKIMAIRCSETRGKHQQQRLLPMKQDDWKFWHSNSFLLILLLRILQTRISKLLILSQTQLKEVSATGFFVSLIHIVVALCGLFGF